VNQEHIRTPLEVFDDHLDKRCKGEFEADLLANYSRDVRMLVAGGVFHGHDGVRTLKRRLDDSLPNATFRYTGRTVAGDVALLIWTATSDRGQVEHGVDTFVVCEGRIVAQTIYYDVKAAEPDASRDPESGTIAPGTAD
jgi:hypothetical protein